MKISSERLKEAVNTAGKGCGYNKLIPLTELIGINLNEGKLKLYSTDMTNFMTVTLDKVSGEDANICVEAEKFTKLVSKITSSEIEMNMNEDSLIVKANGVYKLPIIMDEEGIVEFPQNKEIVINSGSVKLTSVLSAYNINRNALAKTLEQPYLTGYYCGEKVISTDSIVITFNDFSMFGKDFEPMLISPQMMYLLTLNNEEDIKFGVDGDNLVFSTDNIEIRGPKLSGIEDYPIDAINEYLNVNFESKCKISKQLLLDVLDRLSLFLTQYDKNGAYFTFGRKGLKIYSKKDSSVETVNYIESDNFTSFTCLVDIVMLKEQLQACPEDTITIWYGNENALKLETGNVIQIIALLDGEE